MIRRQLPRVSGIFLLCLAIFGLSDGFGSGNGEPGDQKLEAFIVAASAVDAVIATWQARIVRTDDLRAKALRDQANIEIRESIESAEGISFAEYQEIRHAIAVDSEMRARVTEIMRRRHQD